MLLYTQLTLPALHLYFVVCISFQTGQNYFWRESLCTLLQDNIYLLDIFVLLLAVDIEGECA
jgi:hypothetical protein